MSDAPASRLASAVRGAAFGIRSALVYAAAECLLVALLPRWLPGGGPSPIFVPGFAVLLALGYAALGALLGAALGAALRGASSPRLAGAATLAVLSLHIGHLVRVSAPNARLAVALAGAALATLGPLWRALSSRPSLGPAAAGNPFTASLIAVGTAAIAFERARGAALPLQAGAALVWAAAVLLASFAAAGLARRVAGSGGSPRPLVGVAVAAGVALAVFGAALAAGRPVAPALPAPGPRAEPADARPDVVLVTLDTTRSDHLSVYGYERDTTPNLEAFAREATLYTRAIASADITLSTHASLFTGLYARHHGARVNRSSGASALADHFRTLPEILKRAGFLTLAVIANPSYLAARFGFDQGFAVYDDRQPLPFFPVLGRYALARALADAWERLLPGADRFEDAKSAYRRAEVINRAAFALLDAAAERGAPLLLFVNYMDPHWPYDPPSPYDRRYPGRSDGPTPGLADFRAIRHQKRALTPDERRHMVSQYDGEIAYMDRELGRLFERLRTAGRWDDALVIVTSDHGEAFGEHGLVSHGVSVNQHQVHVPLLVKFPGQREARVVDAGVSSVDVLPTVLEAVGLPLPDGLAGESLRADGPRGRPLISESHPDPVLFKMHPRFRRTQRALFAGDLKLVASTPGGRELYDLSVDPGETRDLYGKDPRGAALEQQLDAWLGRRPEVPGTPVTLDDRTRDRLRALGYGQ